MANDIVLPFAGQARSQAFAVLHNPANQESLADGIGSSYGVIGYKGKVWSLRYRGETHVVTRVDDGSPASFIDVIIVRQAPHKSKSFYEGGFDQNASAGKRPTCASLDSVVPDADVQTKQASACAICPRNEWKVGANGRKGRDCTDYKRLAVMLLPSLSKTLLGAPLMEPVFLRVPPASLNDLALAGETLESQGYHYAEVVTRISFDPQEAHPKMVFRPIQQLTDREAPIVLPMRDDPMTKRIVEGDRVAPLLTHQPQQNNVVQLQPAPVQQAPVQQAPVQQAAPTQVDTGFAQVQVPTGAAQQPVQRQVVQPQGHPGQQPQVQQTVDTGFDLDLTATVIPASAVTPPQQTVADTGEAVESDPSIDDKIRAMFPPAG